MTARREQLTGAVVAALGWGRVTVGTAMVVAPGLVARAWLGTDAPALRLVLRSLGARDLALGVGSLAADERSPWLWAGVVSDAGDALASLPAMGALPRRRLVPVALLALGAAAAGATTTSGYRPDR